MSTIYTYSATLHAYKYTTASRMNGIARSGGYDNASYEAKSEADRRKINYVGTFELPTRVKTELKGKQIKEISLAFGNHPGGANRIKSVNLYSSLRTTVTDAAKGSDFVGTKLGTISGRFYNNTVTVTLNRTSNAALFEALRAQLRSGADGSNIIVSRSPNLPDNIYGGGAYYSANYCEMDGLTVTVTLEDATVFYGMDGNWVECEAYIGDGGEWKRVSAKLGKDGEWK